MNRHTRAIGGVAVILAVAGVIAGVAIAQTGTKTESEPSATSTQPETTFLGKVAANLGTTQDALVAAIEQANLAMINEAVAAGRLTAEAAETLKARLGARQALRKLIAQGVASGQLTEDQAALLADRVPGGPMLNKRGMEWDERPGCRVGEGSGKR